MSLFLSNIASTFITIATIIYYVAIVFLIVEAFVPGFGFFGISGLAGIVISLIVKVCLGVTLNRILLELVIALIIIIALLVWIIISARKGLISKSSLISKGTSIPTYYNDDDLKIFINQKGETVTTCKPVGKIRLDDEIYDCLSLDGYLNIGENIIVVDVKDNILQIHKVKEGK